jgi:nitric oxide reductase subunit C
MRKGTWLLLLVLVVALAACGGGAAPSDGGDSTGDASAGETVFSEVAAPACNTCHSLEPGVTLVGPSLANIGAEAGSMVADQSAEEYLRESIVNPSAFMVPGFADLMPATYGAQLTEKQINDLVAYLLTLK